MRNSIFKSRTPQSTCLRSLAVQGVAEARTEGSQAVRHTGMDPGERRRGRTRVEAGREYSPAVPALMMATSRGWPGVNSLSSHSCLQGTVTREAVEMCQELPVRSGIHAESECTAPRVGNGREGERRRPWPLCPPGSFEAPIQHHLS